MSAPDDASGLGCEIYDFLGLELRAERPRGWSQNIVTIVPERPMALRLANNASAFGSIRAEFQKWYGSGRRLKPRFTTSRPPELR